MILNQELKGKEEIIGDISDEFDEIDLNFSKIDESTYVFDAKISLKFKLNLFPVLKFTSFTYSWIKSIGWIKIFIKIF